jgi:ElaB/YqjD/DUF883 family membrane-anchored ribosome-binding protein
METRSENEIEQSTEKLLEELRGVVREGEELLRTGAENLSEHGAAAREKLAAALDVARETQRRLQETAAAGARRTDELVHEYPYQAIGIALGLGLLIGVLASRR